MNDLESGSPERAAPPDFDRLEQVVEQGWEFFRRQHPGVAQRREDRDATPIARTVVGAVVLAQAYQVDKIGPIQNGPLKD